MAVDRDALLRTFLVESEEDLALMEDRLLALEDDPATPDAVAEIFRVVHTLKGNAGIFGFEALASLSHVLEDALEPLRSGHARTPTELVGRLLEALDALRRMLSEAVDGHDALSAGDRALIDLLHRAAEAAAIPSGAAAPAPARRGADVPGPAALRDRTLRVDVAKLDRLVDVAGEVGIARGRVVQLLEDPKETKEAVLQAVREADYLHLELQELVMKLRMVPVGPSLRRHGRTVRDMAAALGKRAQLVVEGDEVELDLSLVEHLRDPLTHMIRNALDHGIEPPAERLAAGKDAAGRVTLRTASDAGSIVIQVSDDGRGIDRARILARARAVGLVGETEEPGDPELCSLIFSSGFTTAGAVTDLSGRGVGMDVVRRNIEALRGSVRVTSIPGRGSTFTLRMPLTLAVIDGFAVEVAGETFILPLDAVTETVGVPAHLALERGGDREGSGVVAFRGRPLGCVRLRRLLGIGGSPRERESVVVARRGGRDVGLVVDRLHGEQQTLVKPVPRPFRGLPGIAGSAILGNGRVALILDVGDLLDRHLDSEEGAVEAAPGGGVRAARPAIHPSQPRRVSDAV